MDTMPKAQARAKARRYSRQYLTFWYVREVSRGSLHHGRTTATTSVLLPPFTAATSGNRKLNLQA